MNQSQAKEWLPLIQALAEGKTIQKKLNSSAWISVDGTPLSQYQGTNASDYRIKPEPKKQSYRIGLFKNEQEYFAMLCMDSDSEAKYFVRWLTDRIEYELPEGEA